MRRLNIVPLAVIFLITFLLIEIGLPLYKAYSDKKPSINFLDFIDEGERLYLRRNKSQIEFLYDSSELSIKIDTTRYALRTFAYYMRTEGVVDDATAKHNLSPYLYRFIDSAAPDKPYENGAFIQSVFSALDNVYQQDDVSRFSDRMLKYARDSNKIYLVEPILYAQADRYFTLNKVNLALEKLAPLFANWLNFLPFQKLYTEALWQSGNFRSFDLLLKTNQLDSTLQKKYESKIERIKQSMPTTEMPALSAYDYVTAILAFVFLGILFFWAILDIFDYIKIFLFYKNEALANRLYHKNFFENNDAANDLYCPVCGKSEYFEKRNQPFHLPFKICKSDGEILVPKNCCVNCGNPLDKKYLNCPACGFNQKGELSYIFAFDLFVTLLFGIFALTSILLFGKHFFPRIGPNIEWLKVVQQTILILGLFLSLSPFLIRDLRWERFSILYRFDRFFFVALDKFVRYIFVFILFKSFVSPYLLFNQTLYFTPLDIPILMLHCYGFYKLFQFGQEHKTYYEQTIKTSLINGLLISSILAFVGILKNVPELVFNFKGIFDQVGNLYLLNILSFLIISITIYINNIGYSKKGSWRDIIIEHKSGIILLVGAAWIFSVFSLFHWFITKHYVSLNLMIGETTLLGAWWFILGRRDWDQSVQNQRNYLAIHHNFYIFIFVLLIFVTNILNIFSIFYTYTDIWQFAGLWNTFTFLSFVQLNQFLDFTDLYNSPFFLPTLIFVLVIVSFTILIIRQFRIVYNMIQPAKKIDKKEAKKVMLLIRHFDKFVNQIGSIQLALSQSRREDLRSKLLEEKYLLNTYNTDVSSKKGPTESLNNLITQVDRYNKIDKESYKAYCNEVKSFQQGHHLKPVDAEENLALAEEEAPQMLFRPVILWEEKLYESLVRGKSMEFLHVTENIWSNSIRLYARALKRFLLQSTAGVYGPSEQIYRVSGINYFLLIFSRRPFFPPSIEKLVAMKWHGKRVEDFVYIYFCDNFPQVKTGNYLTQDADINLLRALNANADYLLTEKGIVELRNFYYEFLNEVRKYGYRCEFYPIDTTIHVEKGRRTRFDNSELGGKHVSIHNEYYQAKFVLVVERGNFMEYERIQGAYQSNPNPEESNNTILPEITI